MKIHASRLYHRLYPYRRSATLAIYGLLAVGSYLLAYLVRFDFSWPAQYTSLVLVTAPLLALVRVLFHASFGVSAGRWRFVSTHDVLQLVLATTSGTVVFYIVAGALPLPVVPRSVLLLEWILTIYLTAGLWIAYRVGYERVRYRNRGTSPLKRVLIVGAGDTGNRLAREMRVSPSGYEPVGFVDDDPSVSGMRLQRLAVLGATSDLPQLAARTGADEIIIAVPSASPAELRAIVERCEATELPFKVLPGIAEVLEGNVNLSQLREVRIEDLLGRPPIRLELPELSEDLRGETVLITGAAGSIGSELARQVALHGPAHLLLLDQAETELYFLELELRERFPQLSLVPIVGDIVDQAGLERVFGGHAPSRVYHAAAYKHVPMMESNCREAIRNNVIGTWRVAEAAGRHGVGRFVLVSTDKAVQPVNVMGATKRMAEMIVMELQSRYPQTTYAAVRFGNVLGSNGSVIPIFKRQLERGKPLTVTHPDVTRYFMTIPEAVQLILQASRLPNIRGHIAMLEMGEPVRIADLARNLLSLSGVRGNGDRIVYTGLRPGEKLHEELVAPEEGTEPTAISKVRLVVPPDGVIPSLSEYILDWEDSFAAGMDGDVIRIVSGMFPGLQIGEGEEEAATGVRLESIGELEYLRRPSRVQMQES